MQTNFNKNIYLKFANKVIHRNFMEKTIHVCSTQVDSDIYCIKIKKIEVILNTF